MAVLGEEGRVEPASSARVTPPAPELPAPARVGSLRMTGFPPHWAPTSTLAPSFFLSSRIGDMESTGSFSSSARSLITPKCLAVFFFLSSHFLVSTGFSQGRVPNTHLPRPQMDMSYYR